MTCVEPHFRDRFYEDHFAGTAVEALRPCEALLAQDLLEDVVRVIVLLF